MMHICLTLFVLALSSANGALSGRVVDEEKNPIANAIVEIYTGKPRSGPAHMCPSCYPECAQSVVTDRDGRYRFEGLNDEILFSVAAGASNYEAYITSHLDPRSSEDTEIVLPPLGDFEKHQQIVGRIVDLDGNPLPNVMISVGYGRLRDGSGGSIKGNITELTMSDAKGVFRMIAKKDYRLLQIEANRHGFAISENTWSMDLADEFVIKMGPGANLQGRLVYRDKPLANVEIEVTQKERSMGNIVTPFEIATDADGRFLIEHLPPNLDYVIATKLGQRAIGVFPVSLIAVPDHGQQVDLGDIQAADPCKLKVTVKTDDGSPFPENSIMYIGREHGWYGLPKPLVNAGEVTIVIEDATKDHYNLTPRIPGYRVESATSALSSFRPNTYDARLNGDSTITFVMTKEVDKKSRP